MLRRLPIALQVMLLVALATLVTSAAMIAIAILGPPPREPPQRIDRLAEALATGRQPRFGLRLHLADAAPEPGDGLARSPALAAQLSGRLGGDAAVVAFTEDRYAAGEPALFGDFRVGVRKAEGRWLVAENGPNPALSQWRLITATTIALVLAGILLLGLLLARRIVDPIRELGRAAERNRAGEAWSLPPPAGPPEVRQAALSLQDLHRRTVEQAEQRLTMLAAIAHDIGTPLARLAFRIEPLPDGARETAMAEIETIRRLLADSLTLARGWSGESRPVTLGPLCERIVERERALGHDVRLAAFGGIAVLGDELSLERLIQNLIDNALRYGGRARLALVRGEDEALLSVEDDGPGFPDMPAEELLRPFVRGEVSRNSATGGSGLGLAIAAQIAERHGGAVELGASPGGGARVQVRLRLADPPLPSAR